MHEPNLLRDILADDDTTISRHRQGILHARDKGKPSLAALFARLFQRKAEGRTANNARKAVHLAPATGDDPLSFS